jgi:metal-dependent amidase/aminoacylase/carboxypeptidase family protein
MITVRGRGGHAAHPHTTHDPVLALASVVVALHTQVVARVDPVVGAVLVLTQLVGWSGRPIADERVASAGSM